jgi:hypothetical protein
MERCGFGIWNAESPETQPGEGTEAWKHEEVPSVENGGILTAEDVSRIVAAER